MSTATIAARIAITADIAVAVNMKDSLRPRCSILHQVPKDATRNQTWRIPETRRAVWWDMPTDFSKMYVV